MQIFCSLLRFSCIQTATQQQWQKRWTWNVIFAASSHALLYNVDGILRLKYSPFSNSIYSEVSWTLMQLKDWLCERCFTIAFRGKSLIHNTDMRFWVEKLYGKFTTNIIVFAHSNVHKSFFQFFFLISRLIRKHRNRKKIVALSVKIVSEYGTSISILWFPQNRKILPLALRNLLAFVKLIRNCDNSQRRMLDGVITKVSLFNRQ